MSSLQSNPTAVPLGPRAGQYGHPRRVTAGKSVSLLHAKLGAPGHRPRVSPGKTSDGTDSPSSLAPGMDSSGGESNAEKWFENTNNNVRDQSQSFADDEPPFFMHHSSGGSSGTPPQLARMRQAQMPSGVTERSGSLPMRTNLLHIGTDGSSTEDYRGVIDDLTIENKKLKRRLKRYQKLQDSHLRDQKLFEVRVHGLPPAKKRELEETLRNFAANLGNGFPADGYEALLPALKAASSQTSYQNTDSAYASMSASGPGSSAPSGSDRHQRQPGQTPHSRRRNIQTYLHHIPEGLMPQQNPASMSERAKKKVVIHRLEQIFTGKSAAGGRHHHPLQQQEVSRLAARYDLKASGAAAEQVRPEGNREACILPRDELAQGPKSAQPGGANISPLGCDEERQDQPERAVAENKLDSSARDQDRLAEQRPTRPLDLDPYRAQVAADNLRYIRHLGFSPSSPRSSSPPEDDHGWIYLNLLTNMAQLHTINVTAEFVRKALTEYSSRFELSNDGRKVRWLGTQSERGEESDSGSGANEHTRESKHKRPKLSTQTSGRSIHTAGSARTNPDPKFAYTPLFHHRETSEDTDDSSSEDDDNSTSSQQLALVNGDSSAMTSSGMHTVTTKKRKARDDGPMIFYKSAGFITDLSGEQNLDGNTHAPHYVPASTLPVGVPWLTEGNSSERRGPLASTCDLPDPMDLVDNPIPQALELSFPPNTTPRSTVSSVDTAAMEVTGIGGVWPADNFAIDVKSSHRQMDDDASPVVAKEASSIRVIPRLAEILDAHGSDRSKLRPVRQHEVISSERKDLPPSRLPPALNWMPADDNSDDDSNMEEDDIDEMEWQPHVSDDHAPSAAPQPVELHYDSSSASEDDSEDEADENEDDDDDDESEGSVDLLAAARKADPAAIRAKELEYDAISADRLAEEIPAGSSAATAGGGSGYASPVGSNVDLREHKRATRHARRKAAAAYGLNRAKDTDSMVVQDPRKADTSSDEDDMASEDDDVRS